MVGGACAEPRGGLGIGESSEHPGPGGHYPIPAADVPKSPARTAAPRCRGRDRWPGAYRLCLEKRIPGPVPAREYFILPPLPAPQNFPYGKLPLYLAAAAVQYSRTVIS